MTCSTAAALATSHNYLVQRAGTILLLNISLVFVVAQGDPKAPPIAKTKDADNDAKAASAPTQRKGVMSKSKKRNLTKQRQKARQLAAASPETAAAAPLSEQPQQAEAAVHQEEVLTKMQVKLLCSIAMDCVISDWDSFWFWLGGAVLHLQVKSLSTPYLRLLCISKSS